ncbi:hypothetical protein ACJJIG_09705 [Microbulbifer sp. SSSA007]|uniref:hypothetical protein n=1 Tax=Microbulbifer sp. SSSA007 TaxID=3243379 RepID=UPI00403A7BA7
MSRKRTLQSCPRLSRWQTLLLLLVFLSVRGLAPAGFMPAAFAAGTPYGLCHGDSRSALLLNALATPPTLEHHHNHQAEHSSGHNHDALTAHSFADNHCNFSAAATVASVPVADLDLFSEGQTPRTSTPGFNLVSAVAYTLPLIRAPPRPSII